MNASAWQKPLSSLADGVAVTRRIIALQNRGLVVAGRSWAASAISEPGVGATLSTLVYVASCAPDAGEDYTALAAKYPMPPASAGLVKSGGFAQLSEEAFLRDFAGDIEANKARILCAVQGRISDTLFSGKTTNAA